MPAILDQRLFLPTRNFARSIDFYTRLGWSVAYRDESLVLIKLGPSHIFLQNAYAETWANNTMVHLVVEDAAAWYGTVSRVKAEGGFEEVTVHPPRREAYGAMAVHVLDPAGVLLFFAQLDKV